MGHLDAGGAREHHAEEVRNAGRRRGGVEPGLRILLHQRDVQARVGMGIDRHGGDRRHEEQRAVGRGVLHRFVGDLAAGTGAVLHDHRLAERGAHMVGEQSREQIARSARGETEHDADRAFLCGRRLRNAE